MERKLADAEVSEEEQNNLLKYLEQKETEYMRLQRHKMGVDDFELLTIIGRGAFGEVVIYLLFLLSQRQWTRLEKYMFMSSLFRIMPYCTMVIFSVQILHLVAIFSI